MQRYQIPQSGQQPMQPVSAEPTLPEVQHEEYARVEALLLRRVELAFNFVQFCQDHMGKKAFPAEYGSPAVIEELDIHPAAEGTYRNALKLMDDYMAGRVQPDYRKANRTPAMIKAMNKKPVMVS